MTNEQRAELESIGDRLEAIARVQPEWGTEEQAFTHAITKLFSAAWDIKQIAREGTASEGW